MSTSVQPSQSESDNVPTTVSEEAQALKLEEGEAGDDENGSDDKDNESDDENE